MNEQLESALQLIRDEFKGYHLEITLYPAGGMIDATGCEECGTSDSVSETYSWNSKRGTTFSDAIIGLKAKLAKSTPL